MKTILIGVTLLAVTIVSKAQIPAATDSLQAQAKRMAEAMVASDFTTYLNYLNPDFIQMWHGTDYYKDFLEGRVGRMHEAGGSYQSVTLDKLSHIVKAGGTYQATIRQCLVMINIHMRGRTLASSTLIGLSSDSGASWRFVDEAFLGKGDLQRVIPNLSHKLTISASDNFLRYEK